MRHKKKIVLGVSAGVAGLLLIPLSQAFAGSSETLGGLAGFNQVLMDTASGSGYVFLAGTNGITVADPQGNVITTIDQGDPVSGLALGPGGTTLYAGVQQPAGSPTDSGSPSDSGSPADTGSSTSSPPAYAIDAISVSSLGSSNAQIPQFPLPGGDVPHSLAYQGGTLWVSYTDGGGQGGIGSIGVTAAFTPATSDDWQSAPDLAADPDDPSAGGTLVAAAGNMAQVYTPTAAGTLTANAGTPQAMPLDDCSGQTQLAVAPGGANFYAACAGSAGAEVNEYAATSNLSAMAAPSVPGSSVAVGTNGAFAAGSGSAIDVYNPSGTRVNIVSLTGGASLVSGGLAWDGSQLDEVTGDSPYALNLTPSAQTTTVTLAAAKPAVAYTGHVPLSGTVAFSSDLVPGGAKVTVTRTGSTAIMKAAIGSNGDYALTDTSVRTPGTYTYHFAYPGTATKTVSVNVARNSASVKLGGPAQEDVTKSFALTGELALKGGTPPAHSKITIKRVWGRQVTRYTVYTAAGGTFQLRQSYGAAGKFIYTATYAGDAAMDVAGVSGGHTVKAVLLTPALSLTSPASYNYYPTMRVAIHLGPTYRNRTVYLYEQETGGKKRLLGAERVNASGVYNASFRSPYRTTFTAVFKGDGHYAAKTVTRTVTVVARVTLALGGSYGSKTIDGTGYRLYHHTGQLHFTESVLPANKYGECGWIEVQEYYNGAWHSNENTPCTDLSASSQLISWLSMTNADRGYEYRLRAHFDRSSSDASDLNSQTTWQYIMVET